MSQNYDSDRPEQDLPATSIKVTDIGNGKSYTATVVGYDATQDVAVLHLRPPASSRSSRARCTAVQASSSRYQGSARTVNGARITRIR